MYELFLNKFWKRFLLGAFATLWGTATIWASGGHIAFRLAGIVTTIVLFVMAVVYCDNDE